LDLKFAPGPASKQGEFQVRCFSAIVRGIAKVPIHIYRWTLKPLIGGECRHLPTCSEYALDAIETNGAWRGWWLALARVSRCHPWGTSGFDPAPDIGHKRHPFAPWRYGRWR
jgi:putative membrane protein insertion efficiency factor